MGSIAAGLASHLFADIELARRLERAEGEANARFVEASARAFPERGAHWREVAGAYALFDGVASPTTQTFCLGLFEPATTSVLDELEAFFFERGAVACHEVSPLAGVATYSLLQDRGYRPVELTSVLVQPVGELAPTPLAPSGNVDTGLHVRVAGPDEADLVADTLVRGWQSEMPEAGGFLDDFRHIQRHRREGLAFLVEQGGDREGTPIAIGMLAIHGGVAQLAGACTVPEARRRGAQNALLSARLRHAARQGCDVATMGAAPGSSSQRNAERNGFQVAYTRLKWQLDRPLSR